MSPALPLAPCMILGGYIRAQGFRFHSGVNGGEVCALLQGDCKEYKRLCVLSSGPNKKWLLLSLLLFITLLPKAGESETETENRRKAGGWWGWDGTTLGYLPGVWVMTVSGGWGKGPRDLPCQGLTS